MTIKVRSVDEIMPLEPLRRKWESFGWAATEMDGHDMKQVLDTLDEAHDTDRPSLIIAHTVKGKGVSFMEGKAEWHGKAPNADELARALAELNAHG